MGTVYEASHRDLEKRVAIKTLHRHYSSSPDVRVRFLREGKASSRIRHPNVVDVYDVALEGDMPYLVMEFLEGEDLSKRLAREGALSVMQAADVLLPVVSALAAAHELGVVHRDLKPENILLCNERGTIKPKVVDFGISKIINPDEVQALTGTAAMLGTPYYMSPEQATQAKSIDFRADIYSLGVVLYECLVGRRPFDDASLYSLMQRIVKGDFRPPRAFVPSLPERVDQAVVRAMACDPAQRFQTTRDFGRALLEFGSERTRAVVAHEFGEGHASSLPPAPRDSGSSAVAEPTTPLGISTTLGQSVHNLDSQPRPRSGRSPALLIGSGVGLLAVVGAGWLALGGSKHEPQVDVAASVVGAAPSPPSSTGPSFASSVVVQAPLAVRTIVSEPSGASVSLKGTRVGVTPYVLSLPTGEGAELDLQADGYQVAHRSVAADAAAEVKVVLEPLPKPDKKTRAPTVGATPTRPKLAPR
jgi:eukaryotic-like serine/threonine-protein kinase